MKATIRKNEIFPYLAAIQVTLACVAWSAAASVASFLWEDVPTRALVIACLVGWLVVKWPVVDRHEVLYEALVPALREAVEIEAVLQTARRRFPDRRILVAFQPHQYQRTLLLLDQFAASLAAADTTLIAEIYGARESDEIMASVSAGDLVNAVREHGGDAHYGGPVRDLAEQVAAHRRDGDVVLVLGAGDIDQSVGGIVGRI